MIRPRAHRAIPALIVVALTAAVAGCSGSDAEPAPQDAAGAASPEVGLSAQLKGASLTAVAADEDSVWALDNAAGTAIELDPSSGQRLGAPVRLGGGPSGLAVDPEGVWVISGDDRVRRIDPADRGVSSTTAPVGDPGGIAVDDGVVWVSSRSDGTVSRFDAGSGDPIGEPIAVGSAPGEIAIADDRAWVANTDAGTVTPIETSSGEPQPEIEAAGFQVLGLSAGSERLWAAVSDEPPGRAVEIRPIGFDGEVGDPIPVPASNNVALAAGTDLVWVTIEGGPLGTSGELDAPPVAPGVLALDEGGSELADLPLDGQPLAAATGAGGVWIVGGDTVTQVVAE